MTHGSNFAKFRLYQRLDEQPSHSIAYKRLVGAVLFRALKDVNGKNDDDCESALDWILDTDENEGYLTLDECCSELKISANCIRHKIKNPKFLQDELPALIVAYENLKLGYLNMSSI